MRSLATYAPWLYLASGLLASTLFYLLPLLPGLVTRRYFDQLSGDAPATFSEWTLGAALLTLALVRAAQLTGATAAETTLNQTHAALLRKNMLQRILERPAAGWEPPPPLPRRPRARPGARPEVRASSGQPPAPAPAGASTTGETISRFRDDVTHIAGFMSWTLDPLGQSLMYLTALVVLLRIDARLTLAVFLPLLLMLLVVRLATARIQRYRREAQEAIGGVTGLLGELFGAVLAVKVAGAEERIVERLRARGEARRRATLRDLLFTQLLGTVSYNTASLATGVILLVAGQSLQAGTLTVGDFALFLSYLAWLTQMTGFFGNFVTKIRQVGVSFDRAAALVQDSACPARRTARRPGESSADWRLRLVRHGPVYLRGPLPPVPAPERLPGDALRTLEAQGLTYRHPGSGRGGRGECARGPARWAGHRRDRPHPAPGDADRGHGAGGGGQDHPPAHAPGAPPGPGRARCSGTGSRCATGRPSSCPPAPPTPPRPPACSASPWRTTSSWASTRSVADLPRALRLAVLEEDVRSFPTGLATPIGPRGVRLSGGQAQRAAAARMFVRRPELLVVDDLSSALDAATERELWARLSAEPDAHLPGRLPPPGGPAPGRPGGRPGRGAGAGPGPPPPPAGDVRRDARPVAGRGGTGGGRRGRRAPGRSLEWPDHEDGQNQHGQHGEDGQTMGTLTPLRRQYLALKQRHPDAILFFRLGDFYETFDGDAELTARTLQITLTSREMGKGLRVPMAGVPYHAVEAYIARLIGAGHRVAVCEQVEDGGGLGQWRPPKEGAPPARGMMAREVMRVVTPGTVVEPRMLEARRNNYLCALIAEDASGRRAVRGALRGLRFGLAQADLTTGEFAATELSGEEAEAELERELDRLRPAECLVPRPLDGAPAGTGSRGRRRRRREGRTARRTARRRGAQRDPLRPLALRAGHGAGDPLPALRREQPGRLRLRPPPPGHPRRGGPGGVRRADPPAPPGPPGRAAHLRAGAVRAPGRLYPAQPGAGGGRPSLARQAPPGSGHGRPADPPLRPGRDPHRHGRAPPAALAGPAPARPGRAACAPRRRRAPGGGRRPAGAAAGPAGQDGRRRAPDQPCPAGSGPPRDLLALRASLEAAGALRDSSARSSAPDTAPGARWPPWGRGSTPAPRSAP